jgi:hypothetical protein
MKGNLDGILQSLELMMNRQMAFLVTGSSAGTAGEC